MKFGSPATTRPKSLEVFDLGDLLDSHSKQRFQFICEVAFNKEIKKISIPLFLINLSKYTYMCAIVLH